MVLAWSLGLFASVLVSASPSPAGLHRRPPAFCSEIDAIVSKLQVAPEADAFCSSYLSICTVTTTTVGATIAPVTTTTITSTTTSTITSTNSISATSTSTVYATVTDLSSTTTSTCTPSGAPSAEKRAAAPPEQDCDTSSSKPSTTKTSSSSSSDNNSTKRVEPTPTCVNNHPAQVVSRACSSLGLPTPTTTVTETSTLPTSLTSTTVTTTASATQFFSTTVTIETTTVTSTATESAQATEVSTWNGQNYNGINSGDTYQVLNDTSLGSGYYGACQCGPNLGNCTLHFDGIVSYVDSCSGVNSCLSFCEFIGGFPGLLVCVATTYNTTASDGSGTCYLYSQAPGSGSPARFCGSYVPGGMTNTYLFNYS